MTQIIDLRPQKKIERGGSDDDAPKAFKPGSYKLSTDSDARAAKQLTELIKDAHRTGPVAEKKHPIRDITATDGVVDVDIEFCMIEWDLPMPKFTQYEAKRRGYNVNNGTLDITVKGEVRATDPGFESLRHLFTEQWVDLEITTVDGLLTLSECEFIEYESSIGAMEVPEIDVEFRKQIPAHLL